MEGIPKADAQDRALVAAVLARGPGAFERLVTRYQRLCWHIIDRMVRHPEDTRELCQEAFLQVHRKLPQWRGDGALKSWIAQIAYSVALRHLKRRRIPLVDEEHENLEHVADAGDLSGNLTAADMLKFLHAEIESLPPLQRLVLTLHHLEEMPIGEIAQATGLPDGTIKSHLFRSRARLRQRLEACGANLS